MSNLKRILAEIKLLASALVLKLEEMEEVGSSGGGLLTDLFEGGKIIDSGENGPKLTLIKGGKGKDDIRD